MRAQLDWISAEISALEAQAAALLDDRRVRRACTATGARWRDHVQPDGGAESLFEEELRQTAFCAALRAVNSDPQRPKLHVIGRFPHGTSGGQSIPGSNYGHGNPDTLYRLAPVEPNARYRLTGRFTGKRPTATEISLVDDQQVFLGNIASNALKVDEEGCFSVLLDPDGAGDPGAILRNVPGAYNLCIRDVLGDLADECPPVINIERLDPPEVGDPPDAVAIFPALLQQAVEEIVSFENVAFRLRAENVFSPPTVHENGQYLPSQAFSMAQYAIDERTALVFRLLAGGASYFTLPATNVWGGLGDFLSRTGALNRFQAEPDQDGAYTLVLSLADPGWVNWIDPGGAQKGGIVARWIGFEAGPNFPNPSLKAKLVKLADLDAMLDGSRKARPGERARALAARRDAYLRVKG